MSDVQGAPRVSTVDRTLLRATQNYGTQVIAVATAEVQKLRHDPFELLTRAVQPMLWLLLFGEVMAQVRGISPGGLGYLDFLAPGILAQSVLFVAIFCGISAIWERDLGVIQRYLVSPAPRSALVMGKAVSAAVRGLSQGSDRLSVGALANCRHQPQALAYSGRHHHHRARIGFVLDPVADHRMHREDPRTLHGDWSGSDNANLLLRATPFIPFH